MKRQIVRLGSFLFPGLMARIAYQQLTSPQVKKLRPHELEKLNEAQKTALPFQGFTIQTYQWGNPEHERILLIHGWEGQAGNFADLIDPLLAQKYFVIAFDGPSHGFSSKGPTSLFEFSDLVGQMVRQYQCRKLVSHSFGGVATTYGLYKNQDLPIDKYALLTTPDMFSQRIDDVARFVGISEGVKQRLITRLEAEMQVDVQSIGVSRFVEDLSVKKALIIHDKNDRVIPLAQSQNVCAHWPVCELKVVEGTGHFRILRTPSVLQQVVDFMD
ncbi:MAG: alpha/beta fold hydrolase [Bacteroidota bacterium]